MAEINSGIVASEYWVETNELRWYVKTMKIDHEQTFQTQTALQQKWTKWRGIGWTDEHEWRDVPFVEE